KRQNSLRNGLAEGPPPSVVPDQPKSCHSAVLDAKPNRQRPAHAGSNHCRSRTGACDAAAYPDSSPSPVVGLSALPLLRPPQTQCSARLHSIASYIERTGQPSAGGVPG